MEELVSIIMPSYNTVDYIEESINSVFMQSYSNWELIIVDDASSDDTDNVVKKYLVDPRICYLKNSSNVGAAVSRNRALQKARGRWIAFLDSDDIWYSEKLEKQIKFMREHECAFSYTNYEEIDEKSNRTGVKVTGPQCINHAKMQQYCWPGCLTVMYDASVIGLIQIEDIKKNNDYAMWLKVCKKADCFLLNEYLAEYRRGRKGSISTQNYIELIKWHYRLFRKAEKKGVPTSCVMTVINMCFAIIKKIFYVTR